MKQWRFEISSKQGFPDVHGKDVLEDIRQLNITSVEDVISEKVFLIEADFGQDFAERVAGELLADPVCQDWHLGKSGVPAGPMAASLIEREELRLVVSTPLLSKGKTLGAIDLGTEVVRTIQPEELTLLAVSRSPWLVTVTATDENGGVAIWQPEVHLCDVENGECDLLP